MHEIIKDEINVKEIDFGVDDLHKVASFKLAINNPVLGKRLPTKMKQIIPASKKGDWKQADGTVEICGEHMQPGEYTLQLEPKPEYKDRAQALSTNDALVILDTTITPELEAEGLARDLVRMIQQARKDAGLNVADRIHLGVKAPEKISRALHTHKAYVMEQTLAVDIADQPVDKPLYATQATLDELTVSLSLKTAS